mmetsp:Transcript_62427/g.115909  ORF Transcript_62427/g.115909 Transcript_62427/m.115909 type:complete len:275 (-) Transcript_62427:17-841(-)
MGKDSNELSDDDLAPTKSTKSKKSADRPKKGGSVKVVGLLGALLAFVPLIPAVPWARTNVDAYFGQRFVRARWYYLFGASNHMGRMSTWFHLSSRVCKKYREFAQFNPLTTAAIVVSSATEAGGAAGGCPSWDMCKNNVTQRCSSYTMIAGASAFAGILFVAAVGCVVAGVGAIGKEHLLKGNTLILARQGVKKKYMAAVVLVILATLIQVGSLQFTISGLAQTSYYPAPMPFVGVLIELVAAVVLLIGFALAAKHAKLELEDDEQDGAVHDTE